MIRPKKIRLVGNPQKKRKKPQARKIGRPAPAKSASPRNPAYLLQVGPLNPTRSITMKKKGKKKAPKRPNPFLFAKPKGKAKGHPRGRRRNPNLLTRPFNVLKQGAFALGGLVITRQIPQLVLKDKNSGILGYGANLIVIFVSAAAVGRFAGKEAGQAVGVGGALYLANRIISENFSPIPKALALSGVGDAAAVGTMGAIVPAQFTHPPAYDVTGALIIPSAYRSAMREEALAAIASQPTSMSGRRVA